MEEREVCSQVSTNISTCIKTQRLTLEASRSVMKDAGGRMKGEVLEFSDHRILPSKSRDELDRQHVCREREERSVWAGRGRVSLSPATNGRSARKERRRKEASW